MDHDHKTKKVRGLLCGLCNSTLGRYDDSPEILRKAIAYLERNPYMPVFEFLCPTHGRFEIMLSLSKYRDIYPCPVCEGQSEQVISRPNPPILRGHGFHANDYNAPTQR